MIEFIAQLKTSLIPSKMIDRIRRDGRFATDLSVWYYTLGTGAYYFGPFISKEAAQHHFEHYFEKDLRFL